MNVAASLRAWSVAAYIFYLAGATAAAGPVAFDGVKAGGRAQAVKPSIGVRMKNDGALVMDVAGRSASNICTIEQSEDLVR